jgi:hypothetical protein
MRAYAAGVIGESKSLRNVSEIFAHQNPAHARGQARAERVVTDLNSLVELARHAHRHSSSEGRVATSHRGGAVGSRNRLLRHGYRCALVREDLGGTAICGRYGEDVLLPYPFL